MHQELSKREGFSALWMVSTILLAATVFIILNLILVKTGLNSGLTDLLIIFICAVGIHYFVRKSIISYKYCMIDQELIVHEVIGSKENRVLNLNVDQIKAFGYTGSDTYNTDRQGDFASRKRLYNCTNKSNRCYLIYEEEGKRHFFIFHPSSHMIELIEEKLNK